MAEHLRQKAYEFGNFRLIPDEGLLLRNGEPIALGPKIFATLLYLVEHQGRLVQKSEILDQVWADSFVEENAVSKSVWAIRSAFGEDPKAPQFIQTVPKRGYRFLADVKEISAEAPANGGVAADTDGHGNESPRQVAVVPQRAKMKRYLLAMGIGAILLLIILVFSTGQFRNWYARTGEAVTIRSLAVLPFVNISGDPSQAYFVDGMAEALLIDLAKIRELRVVGRPSVAEYNDAPRDLAALGQKLNVDGFLAGSVVRSGERVRITVQLIHAGTGQSIWADSYDRDLRDVLALQKEVARTIASEIRVQLSPQEQRQFEAVRSVNPEAYDNFLRGRFYLNEQNTSDQDTAIGLLERAVAIDPNFAEAYAELAQAYTWKHFSFTPEDTPELAEKAFVASEKALRIDPDLAAAYLARGRLLWTPANHFPHDKAIQDYQRALALNPNLDEARNQLALVYYHIGALDEALQESYEGVKIKPTNNLFQLRIGQTLNSQAKYEEAYNVLRAIPVKLHPNVVGHQTLWALFNLGRKEEAATKVGQLLKEHPDKGGTFASIQAILAASAGQNEKAEEYIRQALEKGKGFGHFHHTAYTIGCAYALMGKRDEAIKWLEIAADTGFPCYPIFEKDANLDSLRQDPRFAAFLAKLKGQWERYRALL